MPTILRPGAFLLMAALCWALPACWGTRGPALPELSAEHNQIDQRSLRLERIRQVMDEDIAQVESLREQFVEPDPGLYARPFPLDLYKHVAIECLNEPWDPNQLETSNTAGVAGALGLRCTPEFGDRLLVELQERVPQRQEQAIAKLQTLDRLRQLRGKLRQRLSRIPDILRASRSMLAARRAELRQLRATYARRRTEYSAKRWQQLQDRFDALEKDLEALQEKIDRLAKAWPGWSPALDQSVSMLYMELAQLSP